MAEIVPSRSSADFSKKPMRPRRHYTEIRRSALQERIKCYVWTSWKKSSATKIIWVPLLDIFNVSKYCITQKPQRLLSIHTHTVRAEAHSGQKRSQLEALFVIVWAYVSIGWASHHKRSADLDEAPPTEQQQERLNSHPPCCWFTVVIQVCTVQW